MLAQFKLIQTTKFTRIFFYHKPLRYWFALKYKCWKVLNTFYTQLKLITSQSRSASCRYLLREASMWWQHVWPKAAVKSPTSVGKCRKSRSLQVLNPHVIFKDAAAVWSTHMDNDSRLGQCDFTGWRCLYKLWHKVIFMGLGDKARVNIPTI